jgi:hypothetical protein
MRLKSLAVSATISPAEVQQQKDYGDMILAIGEENSNKDAELIPDLLNASSSTKKYKFNNINYFDSAYTTNFVNAMRWIHPNGFDPVNMTSKAILAGTNKTGDEWNTLVQNMNPHTTHKLLSADYLCEVDDPKGIIRSMLTEEVLNNFNNNGVPQHELILKVNDICLLLRGLSKVDGLATNTRVRILDIKAFCIRVQTIGKYPKTAIIPRIRIKFRTPYGKSFEMIRTQFPLRLAYCMTFNKSQGQEFDQVLLDVREPPFAHGHLYVAMSRIRHYSNIRFFIQNDTTKTQLIDNKPTSDNVTYPEILNLALRPSV